MRCYARFTLINLLINITSKTKEEFYIWIYNKNCPTSHLLFEQKVTESTMSE